LATAEKALALDPNLAEAHAARGVALAAGKRYEEAEVEFEKAIALNPNSFEAYTFYARACFAQGNIERAGALFERAGEINPEDYQAPILLIQIYKSLGREKDRKRVARRGVELAERELTRHPENSGPAQLGAAALFELAKQNDPGNGLCELWPSTLRTQLRNTTRHAATQG
jgi:adenylate cyclase